MKLPLRPFLLFPLVAASMAACSSSPPPPPAAGSDAGAPSIGGGVPASSGGGATGQPPNAPEGAPVEAGPPHVDAAIASTDVVVIPSWDVTLGAGYDPSTHAVHGHCADDPKPLLVGPMSAGTGRFAPSADGLALSQDLGAVDDAESVGLGHLNGVAEWIARAAATTETRTSYSRYLGKAGQMQFSGSNTFSPKEGDCTQELVSGVDLGAMLVWGVDLRFEDDAHAQAATRAYGDDVAGWFRAPDADAIGAALAGSTTITIRVLQLGGPVLGLADAVNTTRCSFGAMDECRKTLDMIGAYVTGPFGRALGTPPSPTDRGAWTTLRFYPYKRP
jgi:hypothetical protein